MRMCAEFAKLGNEVTLVIPRKLKHASSENPWLYYGIPQNFSIVELPVLDLLGRTLRFGKIFYHLDRWFFLRALKRTDAIRATDILYARDPELLAPFLGSEHRFIVESHSIPAHPRKFLQALVCAHAIVTLTHLLKEDLGALGVPPEKILVAPDAVDLAEFSISISKEEARQKLALPVDKKIVLYTGHLYSWKGVGTLAEAAKEFSADATLFLFVGGVEPEIYPFTSVYGALPQIKIIPFQKRSLMPLYLKAADVAVLPTSGKMPIGARYTSPLKLFEYMASGTPIVASDLPSTREILSEESALLVVPDDSKAFADGVRRFLAEPELGTRLSQNARTAVRNFTWEKRAHSIFNFILQ